MYMSHDPHGIPYQRKPSSLFNGLLKITKTLILYPTAHLKGSSTSDCWIFVINPSDAEKVSMPWRLQVYLPVAFFENSNAITSYAGTRISNSAVDF